MLLKAGAKRDGIALDGALNGLDAVDAPFRGQDACDAGGLEEASRNLNELSPFPCENRAATDPPHAGFR